MKGVLHPRRAALLLMAALPGCTLIPDYKRPALPVSAAWPQGAAYHASGTGQIGTAAADLGWRDFFVDPRLQALIALAVRENRDLRSAAYAVIQAQGQYRVQHASLFPQIGATGQAIYQGPSDNAGLSFAPGLGRNVGTFRYYSAGIGFSSYEIDLFGRIRSLSREATDEMMSQAENQRGVLISVISQVATTYVAWLADHEQLRVTEQTLASQQESLRLTQARFDRGETDQLTLRQVETEVEQAAANRAQYQRQVAQDENQLVLLVGAPLPADLPPPAPFGRQTVMADLPAGVPSDLLDRRPDIMSAEYALLSANDDIGAARAAFFPRLILTASDGVSSLQFHNLFTSGGTTWGINPQIQVPLLTWGQNEGSLQVSKARRNQRLMAYEKAIQTAFHEVSDALAARSTYLDQSRQIDALVVSSADAYRLARMRFDAGVDSYLTTLDSQRALYTAQQNQIVVQEARYQNLITVYRALGGGWMEHAPARTAVATHPTAG
ncbi:efflux transporter outer membrane subunit [Gluconacetobacter azotocaptans]|uniref:Efflux transporter outer membrane subunit n=1 Tax=Gluconacetobacter azotocaptans TaxID=142834 RepID=A0A7W4JQV8_9PROT|nr:efflux transporter outer membrane subunit [Gluconacetobacter azotocaptans]MBB2189265.1 efflux transporter outer membrane subunit [Gluconacetobacter azotocaptans]MBM9402112.1 efflux transporter outer membrane subunit [Gluconacetobacter azotocaptans]GBQ32430.1 secretion system type I outer membrane efflux pump lipoprotein NodT [Gluconacetobacter azotocaptans DSM 13594]